MELKVRKSSKKSKDLNLEHLELAGEIERADSVILAACSNDVKVRMRAQFIMLFYARLNRPYRSSHFLSKPFYATYLAACTDFAQRHEIEPNTIVLPYDNKVWNKLYDEFCKMLASKYFIPMVRQKSQELKAEIKEKYNGHLPDSTQDNYELAKESIEASIQGAELEGNWDDNNFVIRVLGEIAKMKDLSNINTLLGYHRRRFKIWGFYDGLKIEP
ncbi:MAG: hypothetical protein JSS07_03850 [Proteobacteria bacterium]|nr:hypothetical protein [Pseudomonadota bacterium]